MNSDDRYEHQYGRSLNLCTHSALFNEKLWLGGMDMREPAAINLKTAGPASCAGI